jgi:hypothetical protein
MVKILELFPRRCHARAQRLPDSQRVDPRARVRWKEDMFRHNVELSDCQDFPRSSRNLRRKNALRWTKTLWRPLFAGPYFSSPSSVSCEPRTLRKRVVQAFQWYQERRKPISEARSTVRANTNKDKENALKI